MSVVPSLATQTRYQGNNKRILRHLAGVQRGDDFGGVMKKPPFIFNTKLCCICGEKGTQTKFLYLSNGQTNTFNAYRVRFCGTCDSQTLTKEGFWVFDTMSDVINYEIVRGL